MKILFVTSELVPFVKAGGLADVSGALPKALNKQGHEVRIILPKYSMIKDKEFKIEKIPIAFNVPRFDLYAEIEKAIDLSSNIIIYFIKCDHFYDRDDIYGDYEDNAERAIFFSKSVLELIKYLEWTPDIIHCNDWQTAMLPALFKNHYNKDPLYQNIGILLTIHNLAYQGIFGKEKFTKTGLNLDLFNANTMELWGKLNFMKAGVVFADVINTVSEKYAEEIQTPEFGYGLEKILAQRKTDLFGIMNGIDYEIWDPTIDPYIWYKYEANSLDKKQLNKEELQKESNLPVKDVPLIGIISRLVDQKGFDLVSEIIDELMQFDLQLILLGTGLPKYHELFTEINETYPVKTAIFLKFDNILAHKIEAAADFFLMPSYYEPCGLNQLISLRYGTIPIVRYIGGLADSISAIDTTPDKTGVGFVFYNYNSRELLEIIKNAITFYKNKKVKSIVIKRAMQKDFSWHRSAQKYEDLYKLALKKNHLNT
ncbi:MAG TPA: glycogen synthase [Candidatus Deferrimicrobium sp.]|nr:glycogen synthase [Candidatus Deferrimicrobium sp.]